MTQAARQSVPKAKTRPARLTDHGVWICAPGSALTVTAPAADVLRKPAPLPLPRCLTQTDERGQEKEKGQFYTSPDLAKHYYRSFRRHFDPAVFQMVEPSAGWGAFLELMPVGSFGCDIEPMRTGIYTADFLTLEINSSRPIACLGNPPFGRNAKLAVGFFNHAASQSDVIGFIVPKTFGKTSIINSLDDRFHLLHEEPVPDNAFLFQDKRHSVATVFQIWVRREYRREALPDIKTHPDFKFVSRVHADFAIRRIGKHAGLVHDETWRSNQAHYFIQSNARAVMVALKPAFTKAAQNTAGQPSLSRSEIVSIYSEHISRCSRTTQ